MFNSRLLPALPLPKAKYLPNSSEYKKKHTTIHYKNMKLNAKPKNIFKNLPQDDIP